MNAVIIVRESAEMEFALLAARERRKVGPVPRYRATRGCDTTVIDATGLKTSFYFTVPSGPLDRRVPKSQIRIFPRYPRLWKNSLV